MLGISRTLPVAIDMSDTVRIDIDADSATSLTSLSTGVLLLDVEPKLKKKGISHINVS